MSMWEFSHQFYIHIVKDKHVNISEIAVLVSEVEFYNFMLHPLTAADTALIRVLCPLPLTRRDTDVY